MKLLSWNVNGLRAVLKKGFLEFLKKENPDLICLQEIKLGKGQVDIPLESYPFVYWNYARKPGYSGTAVFSKIKPVSVAYGLSKEDHEGRVMTLAFKDVYLVNVYTPNSQRGLTRLAYRLQWEEEFRAYLKMLEKTNPVIVCGDLNVAHKEIDIKNPKTNRKNAGFTDQERNAFQGLLDSGFIDTFREFHKEPDQYTWWSPMFNCRAKNVGWRIDYFCISEDLRKKLKDAFILQKVMGSDHCPVGIEITGIE